MQRDVQLLIVWNQRAPVILLDGPNRCLSGLPGVPKSEKDTSPRRMNLSELSTEWWDCWFTVQMFYVYFIHVQKEWLHNCPLCFPISMHLTWQVRKGGVLTVFCWIILWEASQPPTCPTSGQDHPPWRPESAFDVRFEDGCLVMAASCCITLCEVLVYIMTSNSLQHIFFRMTRCWGFASCLLDISFHLSKCKTNLQSCFPLLCWWELHWWHISTTAKTKWDKDQVGQRPSGT